MRKRKLFCQLSPLCCEISLKKECLRRDVRDMFSKEKFAKEKNTLPLPVVVKAHSSVILRRLKGVDMQLQRNKAVNLRLASAKINGIVIAPVEENGEFYRVSQVYRITFDKDRRIIKRELVLNNHSKVIYDYRLIPENQIITSRLRKLESTERKTV